MKLEKYVDFSQIILDLMRPLAIHWFYITSCDSQQIILK